MNPWKHFSQLIAPGAKSIVMVQTVNPDGTVEVELASGEPLKVSGSNVSVGDRVVIQEGKITGKAQVLPIVAIEV